MKFRRNSGRSYAYMAGAKSVKCAVQQSDTGLLEKRMRAMYLVLVRSGSILGIQEAHSWIGELDD